MVDKRTTCSSSWGSSGSTMFEASIRNIGLSSCCLAFREYCSDAGHLLWVDRGLYQIPSFRQPMIEWRGGLRFDVACAVTTFVLTTSNSLIPQISAPIERYETHRCRGSQTSYLKRRKLQRNCQRYRFEAFWTWQNMRII